MAARTCPTRRDRRSPTDEVRFVGDPVALRRRRRTATSPRTPSTSSTSTTSRSRPSSTTRPARTDEHLVHDGYPGNVCGQMGGRSRRRTRRVFAVRRRHVVVEETIYQQAYAPVPMETRGIVVEWSGDGADRLGRDPGAPRGAAVPRPAARHRRAPGAGHHARHRRWLRPEGRAACARTSASLLAARAGAGAAEVDRGPPREPAGRRAVAPRARRTSAWPSTTTAASSRRTHRPRAGHRRLPDAVAGRRPPPRSGCCSPAPTAFPNADVHHDVGVLEHPRAHRVPRTVAVRVRSPARCCSTSPRAGSASTPSSCAAGTCCAATSCRTPTRTA